MRGWLNVWMSDWSWVSDWVAICLYEWFVWEAPGSVNDRGSEWLISMCLGE